VRHGERNGAGREARLGGRRVRRLAGLTLACGLLGAMVGCEAVDGRDDGDSAEALVVGFVQAGTDSGWREANTRDIHQAFEEAGIDLVFTDAQGQQEAQVAAVRELIAQRVDVIALSPVVETSWDAVLTEAKDAGIPVVLTDRGVDARRNSLYASFLGSDFATQGERAGQWVVDQFGEADLVQIVELQGTSGSAPANDRAKGFRDVIGGQLSFEFLSSRAGDFSRESGRQLMEEALRAFPNVDLVYAHSDEMGLGAIDAMEAFNITPGRDIALVTVDGSAAGLQALADGKINFIVESSPLVGEQLVNIVTALAEGEKVARRVLTDETTFTREKAVEVLPGREY
jgi:ABC-type sugar transport system substrate-binding protein